MKRREFLKVVGGAAGAAALNETALFGGAITEERVAGLPRRLLGRTGQRVSVVGFPGLALVHQEYDQKRCNQAVRDSFERGVNYFDVAPAYGNGVCETRLGIAMEGIERDQVFLACKTNKRDQEGARRELEQSLKLLKTDFFDLYQMHHLRTPEEVKQALGPGGAMETFLKAKEEGKVRYLGFSAHTTVAALDAMEGFPFETVMFPINFVDFYSTGFGREVMELANRQGAALISIKPMSRGAWPQGMERSRQWWYRCTETDDEVELSLRWTLSLQGLVSGIPPSFLDLLDRAIEAGKKYRPATSAEITELKTQAGSLLPLFKPEEQAAMGPSPLLAVYPDSPHVGSCGHRWKA
jgi:predicted aldo/keto reductase-like oxidoreductase